MPGGDRRSHGRAGKLPDRTVVVRFELRDRPRDNYRLLLRRPTPELTAAFTTWIRPSPYADIVPARQPAGG